MQTHQSDITFDAGLERLAGRFVTPDGGSSLSANSPQVLFIHGAGQATKERSMPLAIRLAEKGVYCFSFDFSGHGQSSGMLAESSLTKRINEAEAAITASGFGPHVALCAFSMGGHIALQLLRTHLPRALLLFYPAVYTDAAATLRFGDPRFTETIRLQESWKDSSCFPLLEEFTGNLMVTIGGQDEVIPKRLIEKIDTCSHNARTKRLLEIEGASHLLMPYIYQREELFSELCDISIEYITNSWCAPDTLLHK